MTSDEFMQLLILVTGIVIGALVISTTNTQDTQSNPFFVVTEMVQCKGNICNAVLDMDDIAILVPFDSTKVHVGDTLYLVK